jgi:hypothetical protein
VRSGDGYLSQRDLTLHFGIGNYENVDSIAVHWQNGVEQLIKDVAVNQVISLEEKGNE